MRWWRSATERTPAPDWLTARPYAHRGLHGGGIIENSRAAFEAAIASGFGIELDVRPARCGTPFVFHDKALTRLCGRDGLLCEMEADAVAQVALAGSGETIPTLAEILELISDRVPILVEVKSDGPTDRRFLSKLDALLASYPGRAAAMSFDPRLVRGLSLPLRGLVVSEEGKSKIKDLIEKRFALTLVRPDFLAYDVRSLPSPFAAAFRRRRGPVLSWTVRTADDAGIAALHADQIIHELPQ
jgi:glycerophosphoryl diester phosphodiesterase